MELESIAYKAPKSIPIEHVHILNTFDAIWAKIADIIKYDFTNDTVIGTIAEYFPEQKNDSVFYLFDDKDEAIAFFNDFRTVKARKAICQLKYSMQEYSLAIQGLIRFFVELVEASPIAFRDDPPLRLEAVIICIGNAVSENNITYDVLRQIHQIIHVLEVYQLGYLSALNKKEEGTRRAKGKQDAVQWRLMILNEFDEYFNLQRIGTSKMSKHQAARSFYIKKSNNEKFAACWRDAETFYKSICSRKQSPTKNKAREIKQKKLVTQYELPQYAIDILNDWLRDK